MEEVDFSDIDQTVSIGLSLAGTKWGRPDVTVGLAGVANQISNAAKAYLATGGLGGIIGDGQLTMSGPEQILEMYYKLGRLQLRQDHRRLPVYQQSRLQSCPRPRIRARASDARTILTHGGAPGHPSRCVITAPASDFADRFSQEHERCSQRPSDTAG